MSSPTRLVRAASAAEVAAALGRAFADDPLLTWVFADPGNREGPVRAWMAVVVEAARRRGHAHAAVAATGTLGAALWSPPDVEFYDRRTGEQLDEVVRGADGARADTVWEGLLAIAEHHPPDGHFYLSHVGVVPEARGRGVGEVLLRRVLDVCDAEGLPAYLESSSARNVPFYERLGFAVTAEVPLPHGGPVIRPMWREPRAQPAG
ncbi:MAG: GNAT family N-acetyltransferase [Acidimicrobiales bacterium]|nr:GNAT family N-acetyltransferase [Acidimicrobiales bacterium]